MCLLGFSGLVGLLLGPALPGPLVRGNLVGDEIYACGTWHAEATTVSPTGGGQLVLLHGWMKSESVATAHRLPIPVGLFGGPEERPFLSHERFGRWVRNPPLRWQVFGGRCYVLEFNSALAGRSADGGLLLDINPTLRSFSLDTFYAWPAPHCPLPRGRGAAMVLNPLVDSLKTFTFLRGILPARVSPIPAHFPSYPANTQFHHFDILVISDSLVEEYVLKPKGRLMSFTHMETRSSSRSVEEPAMSVDWDEPFHVVANGNRRFLVTESGKVFAIPRWRTAGDKLQAVWTGSPIRALVTDTSSGKSYGFTTGTCFEIADVIMPRPHTAGPLRGRTGHEVLIAVTQCSRTIRGMFKSGAELIEQAPVPRPVRLDR